MININDLIQKELIDLEEKENISILFSSESGSRAWGFPSKDSDYDVRFIYLRPIKHYLSLIENKDTIILPITDDNLDIVGWDLFKFLKLFYKPNTGIFGWIQSPIIYKNEFNFHNEILKLSSVYFSPKPFAYHFLGLAKNSYKEVQGKDNVKIKKYFYVFRALLSVLWVYDKSSIPPILFNDLMSNLKSNDILNRINELLVIKEETTEKDFIYKDSLLNDFIEEKIDFFEKNLENLGVNKNSVDSLNDLFIKMLKVTGKDKL